MCSTCGFRDQNVFYLGETVCLTKPIWMAMVNMLCGINAILISFVHTFSATHKAHDEERNDIRLEFNISILYKYICILYSVTSISQDYNLAVFLFNTPSVISAGKRFKKKKGKNRSVMSL